MSRKRKQPEKGDPSASDAPVFDPRAQITRVVKNDALAPAVTETLAPYPRLSEQFTQLADVRAEQTERAPLFKPATLPSRRFMIQGGGLVAAYSYLKSCLGNRDFSNALLHTAFDILAPSLLIYGLLSINYREVIKRLQKLREPRTPTRLITIDGVQDYIKHLEQLGEQAVLLLSGTPSSDMQKKAETIMHAYQVLHEELVRAMAQLEIQLQQGQPAQFELWPELEALKDIVILEPTLSVEDYQRMVAESFIQAQEVRREVAEVLAA